MDFNLEGNKYFKASELNSEIVLLSVKLPYLTESNINFLTDAFSLIATKCKKSIIIDISKVSRIDSASGSILFNEINNITSLGHTIKLIVAEDKPVISFSIGDPISRIDLYLNLNQAVKEIIN